MAEQIAFYRGQRIEQMSPEEMIEAIKSLGTLYNEALQERMAGYQLTADWMKRRVHADRG